MEKLAIVTLVTSPEWQHLAEITLPSQRKYADRIGADFVVLDKRIYPHPHYDKWQLCDLFPKYDRLIYLDADMIVRCDCPDLFVFVPPEAVGGENELLSCPSQEQQLSQFCQRLGIGPLPCPFYLNGGMFVASARHAELFRKPEAVLTDLPWPEQSHFNARLIAEKHPVCFLPCAFNDRHRQGDYLRHSYILHYACMSHQARIAAIERDLHAWDKLFQRETRNRLATPTPQPPLSSSPVPDHDYVSPGLQMVSCDHFFPNMIVGNKATCSWPYLRRQIPHHWYVDRRVSGLGFLNRDEAHILYNTALLFRGQPALEIGCWLGWSTCHLALAGVQLDSIDPILQRRDFHADISASLDAAAVRNAVNLVAGSSPQLVRDLAARRKAKWSFFFIDGNHDAPHPLQDAIACEACAAETCLMLFHDLVSPAVAQGLDFLRKKGWHTKVYHTAQIMGVAWRGDIKPIEHIPDPNVVWDLPAHLRQDVGASDLPPEQMDMKQSFFTQLIRHTQNFGTLTWLGKPIWQNVLDLWTIQETIAQVKPDLLIESGTNRGGSALYYAHLFDLLGNGRVLTIDIRKMHQLSHTRITFIQGSSVAEDVLQQVRAEAAATTGSIMVILDSDHSKAHVIREMEAYASFVTPGSFMMVQDGVADILPMFRQDRPGPLAAIRDFLSRHSVEFEVDHARCQRFLITHHPMGWLRRKQKAALPCEAPAPIQPPD